jgi:hypothetical protein
MKRVVSVGLSACLFLSAGCRSGAERAGERRTQVEVGMTRDEVEERLGEPDGWQENVGGHEVWAYAYKPNVGTFVVWRTVDLAVITVVAATAVGILYLIAGLCRNGISGWPSSSSAPSTTPPSPTRDVRFQRFVFRIGFDRESGRVAFVSSPIPE